MLVFLGNLYYRPNAAAVEVIRSMILPALHAEDHDVRVRVVGRGPDELTRDGRTIEFTGRVDTINRALRGVTLALAPLTAGSGAKMKVLDYLAAGLPVLGTREAVTGLPPSHPGVVVEDDLREWPSLTRLLHDHSALREIGRAGRLCVEEALSWQHIGSSLLRHCHTWLAAPPPAVARPDANHWAGMPRWLPEHANQDALGDPQATSVGQPHWLRRQSASNPPGGYR